MATNVSQITEKQTHIRQGSESQESQEFEECSPCQEISQATISDLPDRVDDVENTVENLRNTISEMRMAIDELKKSDPAGEVPADLKEHYGWYQNDMKDCEHQKYFEKFLQWLHHLLLTILQKQIFPDIHAIRALTKVAMLERGIIVLPVKDLPKIRLVLRAIKLRKIA